MRDRRGEGRYTVVNLRGAPFRNAQLVITRVLGSANARIPIAYGVSKILSLGARLYFGAELHREREHRTSVQSCTGHVHNYTGKGNTALRYKVVQYP
eukprot:CAMPEP_0184349554 /NCGR_PEP_ID=MMETSP1089-20130417/34439_1 /TAXON_ID=38269 ORGANISM="Gloeochaete wittrockiana, Strain SAG46.84" /NCGR_SAMPLE_ID=MMETSP1089 /ASSEMBLY_ACC=CAM_ASM_000445 /LENGTH=96 /DNA_ID=CAMNT_0026681821 /DNA_START=374 /DNA_END=661 /DNA_ORIENTATION=+